MSIAHVMLDDQQCGSDGGATMLPKRILVVTCVLCVSLLTAVVAAADPVRSHAFSIWIHRTDPDMSPGQAAGNSPWHLGRDWVKYGEWSEAEATTTDVFSMDGTYQGGGGSAHVDPLPFSGSVGFAHSDIAVTPPTGGTGLYDFTLSSLADADADFWAAPKVESFATGHDPQQLTAGVFTQEVALGAGSSMYASGPAASATSFFELSATSPLDPAQTIVLASIGLSTTGTGFVDAAVYFNSLASFYSPAGTPTTSSAVESALENNSLLRSAGGLTSDLTLFTYQFSIPSSGGIFSASLTNDAQAQGVPEPSTLALLALGIAGLAHVRRTRTRGWRG